MELTVRGSSSETIVKKGWIRPGWMIGQFIEYGGTFFIVLNRNNSYPLYYILHIYIYCINISSLKPSPTHGNITNVAQYAICNDILFMIKLSHRVCIPIALLVLLAPLFCESKMGLYYQYNSCLAGISISKGKLRKTKPHVTRNLLV